MLTSNSGVVCGQRTSECIADALRKVLQHPEDYPIESCIRTAQPYAARTVVRDIYSEMLNRWQQRVYSAVRA